ncbi:MAG TPA: hypothetical protein VFA70_09530, partial [Dehalococcoidia bacterium]|nr:hypothetical protein [Dehalococcoidia bacterium]
MSRCPSPRTLTSLRVLRHLSGGPDDVAVDSHGAIWISEHDGGAIAELTQSGQVMRTINDAQGPEGIVPLPDGMMLVAQQVPNRIDLLDPMRGTFSAWLQLGAAPAQQGVDGIAAADGAVLVPDSHGGTLLRVPLGNGDTHGAPQTVASGLGRPVDAAQLPDGSIVVTVENAPGLELVSPSGQVSALAHDQSLDDVVVQPPLAYATNLDGHAVSAVDMTTGAQRTLVTGAPDPQG